MRRDVETYGRHARVAFDADWSEDAARRDFTINALYLDPDGTVHDPVGGLADLAAHRVRFVGEPAKRIAEDVLRVLRYYRFEARFGRGEGDGAARAACRDAVPLLPTLSAERVAQEVLRLLAVADPVPALRMMREDGVLAAILPEATRLDRLERLIAVETSLLPAMPKTLRLRAMPPPALPRQRGRVEEAAASAPSPAGGGGWGARRRRRRDRTFRTRCFGWRLWSMSMRPARCGSPKGCVCRTRCATGWRGWRRPGRSIRRATGKNSGGRCTGSAASAYRDLALLLAADGRLDREVWLELLACAAAWEMPQFPIAGRDVTAKGIPPGPRIGRLLAAVRCWWEEGDFRADRAACLARLNELIEQERGPAGGDGAIDGRDTGS